MRKLLTLVLALSICTLMFGQMPGGNRGGMAQQMNGGFYGKIIDSITNKPIEAASVQLTQNKYDSVEKKRKEVIVDGILTKSNGQFNFEGVPIMSLTSGIASRRSRHSWPALFWVIPP